MLQIGFLGFVQPWLLAALATLPALWWLLRVTPPAPRRQRFPAVALLHGLKPDEETPARTPLWLILLRLLALALVILGLAQPVLNPASGLSGSGPLVVVVENDWAAGHRWEERRTTLDRLLAQAEREERPVALLPTAREQPGERIEAPSILTAAQARQRAGNLRPLPWPGDPAAVAEALNEWAPEGSAHAVWLGSGLAAEGQEALAQRLQRLGRLDIYSDPPEVMARLLREPQPAAGQLVVPVERGAAGATETRILSARGQDGRLLGQAEAYFDVDSLGTEAVFDLPVELRNRIVSITLDDQRQAAARLLLDDRWRRRSIGFLATGAEDAAQPLLNELYYLERALAPYAELARQDLSALIERGVSMIVLPDAAVLREGEIESLAAWTEAGGVLLRFAGPRLAESLESFNAAPSLSEAGAGGDPERALLPVRLRRGERSFGGSLTWDQPVGLQPFPEGSPLAGLPVPGDVSVRRQVLAEPSPELSQRTWARLADGTPLVTAVPSGEGWRILVHTTASPAWSDLPLSGLFVEMLRRFAELGGTGDLGGEEESDRLLAPLETLDGFGQLAPPPAGARPIAAADLGKTTAGPRHPPGYYGLEDARRALNLSHGLATPRLLEGLPEGVRRLDYSGESEQRLGPWLLAAGLLLLLLDFLVSLALRGLLPDRSPARGAAAGLAALALLPLATGSVLAQEGDDAFALLATLDTRLAYIETGDQDLDRMSERGLVGLSRILAQRTSVEPESPLAVEAAHQDLRFFPFVYWAISPAQPDLAPEAAANINAYLESGGTLLLDLREASFGNGFGSSAQTPAESALQRLTRDIALPELTPIDPEHVLTRAFYLLQEFPGRYDGGTLWVERAREERGEGVARLIVGTNDWAGAWAVDEEGRPMNAVTPGGERQREFAYRFGVNAVIYALTGNYKDDQVHVPAILERLGQ